VARVHCRPKKLEALPTAMVPASLQDVDFMVKDSKRFADSEPPQANDAKCGLACHTIVKARDYVFTDYGKR